MLLELDRPEWAGWTVLSVSLATRASSLQKSLWRAVSTIIGCVIAVALTANFAQSTLAFDAALALWLALLTAPATMERGQRSYGFALIGFTVPIVTLGTVDQPDPVFHVAVARSSTLPLHCLRPRFRFLVTWCARGQQRPRRPAGRRGGSVR